MNRYGKSTMGGGPSKATATTLCQKCLKRDIHYSYECKSAAQERPYVSRPSRTQQLQNPKLMPKLTSDVPQDLLRKKGLADELLLKAEELRNRKRIADIEDVEDPNDLPPITKRLRSVSISTVSTISTNDSGSLQENTKKPHYTDHTPSPSGKRAKISANKPQHQDTLSPRISTDRGTKEEITSERKRRRESVSSSGSYSSGDEGDTREYTSSRNTRRRYQEHSPIERGRTTESHSPQRGAGGRRRLSDDRPGRVENRPSPRFERQEPVLKRERSLSPFSKRLALTQSRNQGR